MDLFGYLALAWTLVYLGVRYTDLRSQAGRAGKASRAGRAGKASQAGRAGRAAGRDRADGRTPARTGLTGSDLMRAEAARADLPAVAGAKAAPRSARPRRLMWSAVALGLAGAAVGTTWMMRRRTSA